MDKMTELQGQIEYWLVDTQGMIKSLKEDIGSEYDPVITNFLGGKIAVYEDLELTLKSLLKDYF